MCAAGFYIPLLPQKSHRSHPLAALPSVAGGHLIVPCVQGGRAAGKIVPCVILRRIQVVDGPGHGHAVQCTARSAELVVVEAVGLTSFCIFHDAL
jgi:hypothetical protein